MLLSGRRLFFTVLGLSIDQLVAWGVLYYAFAVLSAPIALDLGVSRLEVAAAFSFCLLVSAWVARLIGPVLDARGPASVLRVGALVGPLTFVAIAQVESLASLGLTFVLLGVSQALSLYEPAFRSVVDWCPDERTRSRAMLGLTVVGGFSSTVFLPFTSCLSDEKGWRMSVLLLAGVLALVLIPTRFLLPLASRRRAVTVNLHVIAAPSLKRLAVGLSLHSLASTGVFLYLMWHLVEQGKSLASAAALAGLAGAAQVPGRILAAPLRRLARRRSQQSLLVPLLGLQGAALLGAVILPSALATLSVFVFGAANGMMTLERIAVLVDWYGPANFGLQQGRVTLLTGTARAFSPFAVEAGHAAASYSVVFSLLSLGLGLGAWACSSAATFRAREAAECRTQSVSNRRTP